MTTNYRDLSLPKLAAALSSHKQLALQEVQELPLATAQTRKYQLPLVCGRTGITCGVISTLTVAGHMPLLGQWKDTQVLHPIFSLQPVALLQFARNSWLRFCALTAEETADEKLVAAQELQLRVAALAMLHNLTEVRQDHPWMPEWKDVAANWTSLLSICYWRAYLDSERFKFPQIRISKLEKDVDLRSFLQLCWDRKKHYELAISDLVEEEKNKVAEKALVAIRDSIAGKRPLSVKILWRWFAANMPARYNKDMAVPDGWMWELFNATEKTVFDYTVRDIELFEEIFLSECPTGSSMSHAFLEILRGKHHLLTQHFETYQILVPDTITAAVADGSLDASPEAEPKLSDFATKVQWFRAHAKWKLAQPSARRHRDAEVLRQKNHTVDASFIPRFKLFESDDDELQVDEIDPEIADYNNNHGEGEEV